MTQNFDVTLAGNGYMLVPPPERPGVAGASYRLTVTPFKPAGVRTGIRDWAAALNDTDGTRWRADGMLPELSGYGTVQGLVLGPAVRATPAYTNVFTAAAVFNGALYLATGNYLFKLTLDAGLHVLSTATVGTTAGNITGMFVSTGRLYLALASPATSYASTDGTTITAAPGTQTGTQGFGYANGTWLVSRTSANTLAGSIDGGATWTYLQTEGAIRCTLATGRTALIFHAAGVDELTGQWVTSTSGGTTTTAFTGTLAPLVRATGAGAFADFLWAVDYGGHVYVWHNGTVRLLDRSSITGGRLTDVKGPRGTGVAALGRGRHHAVRTVELRRRALGAASERRGGDDWAARLGRGPRHGRGRADLPDHPRLRAIAAHVGGGAYGISRKHGRRGLRAVGRGAARQREDVDGGGGRLERARPRGRTVGRAAG